MVFGVSLPFRIAEQMYAAVGHLAYQQCQLRQYLDQCDVASGSGDEYIFTVGTQYGFQGLHGSILFQ